MTKEFKVSDFWKDSDGGKHLICKVDNECIHTFCYTNNKSFRFKPSGNYYNTGLGYCLLEPWKEPLNGVLWVNVFRFSKPFDGCFYGAWLKKDEADRSSEKSVSDRIACVKVNWKEGQFDE